MFKKLFKDITRNYGLIVISHADIKVDEDDPEKIKYATLGINKKVKKIVMGLLDILAYIESDRSKPGVSIMHFRSSAGWEAKARFAKIVESDIFSYDNLVKDIAKAVEGYATKEHHKIYDAEDTSTITREEFDQLKELVGEKAKEKVEKVGLQPVVDLINVTLGCKIGEADISDAPALKVLMEEIERL